MSWAGAGWDQGSERRDSVRVPCGVLLPGEERGFPQKELERGSAGAGQAVERLSLVQCLPFGTDFPGVGVWRSAQVLQGVKGSCACEMLKIAYF